MPLSGIAIRKAVENGDIVINPYNYEQALQPNSYDLRLGPKLCIYKAPRLDCKKQHELLELDFTDEGFELQPGILYLGHTVEIVGCPENATYPYVPYLSGKSSTGRLGISVHVTAGEGDFGFVGTWTLEIYCVQPVKIYPGQLIAQASFEPLDGERVPYTGNYQGQQDPQPSRLYRSFGIADKK